MRCRSLLLTFLLGLVLPAAGIAQAMVGIVSEAHTGKPMPYVSYENIHTKVGGITDSSGRISIQVAPGQLVEFHKLGYKTARVRIPAGTLPPYFKVLMEEGAVELEEVLVYDSYRNYRNDSLRNYELYKDAINYHKMGGMEAVQHPFTAMSRHYQSIMRFQKEYDFLEKMRYVDYAFNAKTITNLTGLKGDSLQRYMYVYRPTYEQVRAMPEYTFYSYIKTTVEQWRRRPRYGSPRNSGR